VTATDAARPGGLTWLVLAYRLPATPGLKTVIRRRFTGMGAVYPAKAVAAMPASPAAERGLRRLRSMISEAGGSAQLLRAEVIDGERDLIATFNTAREQEYRQIITGCDEFMAGIEAMMAAGEFRYPDLGQRDAELKRLVMANDVIRTRDTLGAAEGASAFASLARCRTALDSFAKRVYQTDASRSPGAERPSGARPR